jgi:hypothetical protein
MLLSDDLIIEVGAIYIMDRGCLDFTRLYKIHQSLFGIFVFNDLINSCGLCNQS